jgi:hemin uptake protein HemP
MTQQVPTNPLATTPPLPRPCIDSNELLRGAPAVEIAHAGQRYILRVTRENKLILTK